MHPLRSLKTRLSTIPASSWRYRLTSFIWKGRRVKNAKACTFYWVMIPTSVIGLIGVGLFYLVLGTLAIILLAVFTVGGWLCGYTIGLIEDKGQNYHGPSEPFFYPYRYHPRSGKTSKLAPWMIWAPAATLAVIYFTHLDIPSSVVSRTWDILFTARYIVLGLVVFAAICYAIGKFMSGRELHPALNLQRRWDKACPPLTVKAEPPKELAEA
jgi:amino acid transporter